MSLVAASGSIALEGDGKSKLKWLDISTIYHTSLITSRKESLLHVLGEVTVLML